MNDLEAIEIEAGCLTNWHGCNADEKVDNRFPATVGRGIETNNLSDVDLGAYDGAIRGAGAAFANAAGDIHNGKGRLRRRGE